MRWGGGHLHGHREVQIVVGSKRDVFECGSKQNTWIGEVGSDDFGSRSIWITNKNCICGYIKK